MTTATSKQQQAWSAVYFSDKADTEQDPSTALACEMVAAKFQAMVLDKTPALGARLPHIGGDE